MDVNSKNIMGALPLSDDVVLCLLGKAADRIDLDLYVFEQLIDWVVFNCFDCYDRIAIRRGALYAICLLYTSDAADD